MQLRHYFAILRRFWLLVLGLPLLVGLLSLALAMQQPPGYSSSARVLVTQAPRLDADASFPDFNLNHSWLSSEFILDDLPMVISSHAFAEDVSLLLARQGADIPPEAIQGTLRAENLHRSVTIVGTASRPDVAEAIVGGAIVALQTNGLAYWDRASSADGGLRVAVIDPASPAAATSGTRQLVVDVGLRTALALAAAVGIVFLIYYLDDTLRDRRQVEAWVEVPVVGVIPKE